MTAQPIEKPFIFDWHGGEAHALRSALRMTQEQIADQLGCSIRTVGRWREFPASRLSNPLQECMDALYERLTEPQVRRFLHALQNLPEPRTVTSPVVMAAEMALMQAHINELQTRLKEKQS